MSDLYIVYSTCKNHDYRRFTPLVSLHVATDNIAIAKAIAYGKNQRATKRRYSYERVPVIALSVGISTNISLQDETHE